MGISLHRGSTGEPKGGSFTRDSVGWWRELWKCSISLWREPGGGGLLYWGPWRVCKGRLWRQASLSIGAPLGNLEGDSYTRDFERGMNEGSRNGSSLSAVALWGEPGGRAPWLGVLRYMLSKALEMGVCFHSALLLGNMEGCSFPRAFERMEKFLYLGEFLWGIWEICKKAL
jgi:hypothetical protein